MKKTTGFIIIVLIIGAILCITAASSHNYDSYENSVDDNQYYTNSSVDTNTTDNNTTSNSTNASAYSETSKDSNSHYGIPVRHEVTGYCYKVIDGDTIRVDGIGGNEKVRFVGVNTPEKGEDGYYDAKNYIKEKCLDKTVYLDIDDARPHDKYNRTLAIVYDNQDENLNQQLLVKQLAEVMYIPPSEFQKGLGLPDGTYKVNPKYA
ncbi:thermonuclease family protein [Methanobrevibacter wolinii]|uniref:thermonuclease family protein n=1 Tax=Methanobrevibacter wolinii TaxID=190977 RepID=UPI000A04A742|nr:thermonuclease family protein [Methanobrevibacter wolinii]MDD5960617.1 thermonuclease family protein [Methanobrevibacter wolinii]